MDTNNQSVDQKDKAAAVRDRLGRAFQSLRISLIDRCNFRCFYCMPESVFGDDYPFLEKSEWMSFDEIVRLVRIFGGLGVTRLRLTGGEPLLRPQLPVLVRRLVDLNHIEDLALTTNGTRLAGMAGLLADAGLPRITISLDAIEQSVLTRISGSKALIGPVIDGIDAAQAAGLEVKINAVIVKDVNESQIIPLAQFARDRRVTLRFIEFMDVGNCNRWDMRRVVTEASIRAMLDSRFGLEPVTLGHASETANRFRYGDQPDTEVGFVSSVSLPFCADCNRGRLSADGKLFTCLFSSAGTDLLGAMRSGLDDASLRNLVESVWLRRLDRYSEERAGILAGSGQQSKSPASKVEMSYIGG